MATMFVQSAGTEVRFPQQVTVPSAFNATAVPDPGPAAMATTLERVGGTVGTEYPQATTRPSERSARQKYCPPAMATTLVALAGMVVNAGVAVVHTTTEPSERNAMSKSLPQATAETLIALAGMF